MILTSTELSNIERRLKEATLGPYRYGKKGGVVSDHPVRNGRSGDDEVDYYGGYLICESISQDNANFIAHSWQDIKNLIETIRTIQNDEVSRF